MDGNSAHYQPEVIWLAKDNSMETFVSPPADSQPLDAGVFGHRKFIDVMFVMNEYEFRQGDK